MSHEITDTDNMFSVREMPWHRLGVVLDDYPTREEAQPLVHGWEPISEPLFHRVPFINESGEPDVKFEEVPTLGNFRSDSAGSHGGYLGPITPTFVTVSNDEMWDIGEAIQGGGVDVKYETGGSLKGGKKVWLMLALDHPLFVNGDPNGATMHYYVLQNSHDGSGAFRGSATATRVVCANTLRMADVDAQTHGTEFTFRHSKNIGERIEEAREALAGWRQSVQAWSLFSAHMLDQKVSDKGVSEFLTRFIPEPPHGITSDRVRANIDAARGEWTGIYNGVTGEGLKGTAYGLLQASSEYAEHYRRAQDNETAFRRAILKPNRIMTDAKNLALEAALV
jgi:phage/plasmid-like protein (TIGR03299 family)